MKPPKNHERKEGYAVKNKKTYRIVCPVCKETRKVGKQSFYLYTKHKSKGDIDDLALGRCISCGVKKARKNGFLKKHVPLRVAEFQGCLFNEQYEGRCEKYDECIHHTECLKEIICMRWKGFTADCISFLSIF